MPGTRNYYVKQNKPNGQISCISSHMWNPDFFFKVHLYDMKLGGTVEGKEGVKREKAMRQGVVVRMGILP